jgi:hypothetical protein
MAPRFDEPVPYPPTQCRLHIALLFEKLKSRMVGRQFLILAECLCERVINDYIGHLLGARSLFKYRRVDTAG